MSRKQSAMQRRNGIWRLVEKRSAAAVFFSAAGVLISGCGSNLAEVTGVVTLDGEPLSGGDGVHAIVYFQPASGQGASGVGVLDENGVYRLSTGSQQGIAPGEYVATCSASQIIPPKDPGGTPGGKRITDPKYASAKSSGLRFTVVNGRNRIDIPLESGPSGAARQQERP